jgi:hypothetical protein
LLLLLLFLLLLLLLEHRSRRLLPALLHCSLLAHVVHSHCHLRLARNRRRLQARIHLLGESALGLARHGTSRGDHATLDRDRGLSLSSILDVK